MSARPLEAWHPQHPGIAQALGEFSDMARNVALDEGELQGDREVAIPELAGIPCVAFVSAQPHKDLSHPRWSLLAPVRVRPGTTVGVRADDQEAGILQDLSLGNLVLLDTHSTHWVDPPAGYPDDDTLDKMDPLEREQVKREHMSVMFSVNFMDRPSRIEAERQLAQWLLLPLPSLKTKQPRR